MAAETFQQDRQFSTEKFILQEKVLVVVGGVPPEKSIPLTRISPVYECIERRFHSGYLVPLFLAAMSGAVAWRLSQGDLSLIRAIVAGIVACMALLFPFMMRFAPVEGAKFLDRDGAPLFEIYRPMKSAYTYDEFISLLVQRVKEATAQRFNP